MIFEDDRVAIDENSGEHRVAFLTNNGDDLTFSITTDRPNVFETLSVETDQRAAGVSPANFLQSINLTLIADQKAAVRLTVEVSNRATTQSMPTPIV